MVGVVRQRSYPDALEGSRSGRKEAAAASATRRIETLRRALELQR